MCMHVWCLLCIYMFISCAFLYQKRADVRVFGDGNMTQPSPNGAGSIKTWADIGFKIKNQSGLGFAFA